MAKILNLKFDYNKKIVNIFIIKVSTFIICLLPLLNLLFKFIYTGLGANPIEFIVRDLGDWGLRFLILVLLVSSLQKNRFLKFLINIRRMVGLFSFFYVTLHFTSYIVLDQFFYFLGIWEDILKRRYITLGFLSFLLLIPLAITSSNYMIKKMGIFRWRFLHRLVYPASILALIHFTMMIKADYSEPLFYGVVILFLLFFRLPLKRIIKFN